MTIRAVDLLCDGHRAMPGMPVAGGLTGLLEACPACLARSNNIVPPGGIHVRYLPGLTGAARRQWHTFHEAGHAVAGHSAGYLLREIVIDDTTDSGTCTWADAGGEPLAYLTNIWAGQAAALLWLASAGLDTPANRIDVISGASNDAATAAVICARHNLPAGTGIAEATAFAAAHWDTIARVAAVLTATVTHADLVVAAIDLGGGRVTQGAP